MSLMTRRNETQPSAPSCSERVAGNLRELRQRRSWSHVLVADALTSVGVPTKSATIARIERGSQAMTLEQLLALATIFSEDGGLRALVRGSMTVGELQLDDEHATDVLLLGDDARAQSDASRRAKDVASRLLLDARARQIAEHIGRPVDDVEAAAQQLYGRGAGEAVFMYVAESLALWTLNDSNDDDAQAAVRAYTTNAIRRIGTEIRHQLDGTTPPPRRTNDKEQQA